MSPITGFISYRRSNYLMFFLGMLAGTLLFCLLSTHTNSDPGVILHADFVETQNFHARDDPDHKLGENALADEMARKVRVFAMILTMPSSKASKAVHVKATWAKRFNDYIFISSEEDKDLPSIRAVETENRGMLWEKTRQALIYAYKNHYDDFDFFMKADDDTYVIVENLRFLLSKHDPNTPFLMGRRFNKFVKQGYTSGGAGYVISRAALKLIAEGMQSDRGECRKRGGAEDVNLGACAQEVGVTLIDSLDEHGQEVFHPFYPTYMLDKRAMDATKWVHAYNHFPIKTGLDCCSDHSVSFHYVSPKDMYELEFLIYHLYPYGIARDLKQYEEFLKLQHNQVPAVAQPNPALA